MRFSVAIPTYKRPEELKRAINSVIAQGLNPFELIVVSRPKDFLTNEVISSFIKKYPNIRIKHTFVKDAGFLPPIFEAIKTAKGDVLALLDDDAEARKDWLERIASHYKSPDVGAVGGRCINFFDGVEKKYPRTNVVGKLRWHGKPVGNMYKDTIFSDPVNVDFLMGGNSSFNLEILRRSLPDARLGRDVSFYWEMDVGLQIKKLGYQLIFDPKAKVTHYSAPRDTD
ncbi:MAG: glycosyltransferase family 2 protein, partial [Burkholderiales bacterium]|nr:glycosyltransferase family 2 protein [Burkholderiales bacterium]